MKVTLFVIPTRHGKTTAFYQAMADREYYAGNRATLRAFFNGLTQEEKEKICTTQNPHGIPMIGNGAIDGKILHHYADGIDVMIDVDVSR